MKSIEVDKWVSFWLYKSGTTRVAWIRYRQWVLYTTVPRRWFFYWQVVDTGTYMLYMLNILGLYINIKIV